MSLKTTEKTFAPLSKLEELAFLALYRNVLDCLLLQDHNQEVERARQSARRQLALHLCSGAPVEAGHCSKDIRARLLKHHVQEKNSKELLLSSFLDVVLDESVDEITAAFDHKDRDNDEILPIIVRRSPGVQILHLHCQYLRLTSLSSLNLYKMPVQCRPLIYSLGKCCPNLKHLRIGLVDHVLSTSELLNIFYTGVLDELNSAATSAAAPCISSSSKSGPINQSLKAYHRCQVASQLLHPFCRTLEEVRITNVDCDDPCVIGFLLRHLRHLKELEMSDYEFKDYSASIRALWDIWDPTAPQMILRCLEPHPFIPTGTAPLSILDAHSNLIVQAYFTGSLSLTSLFLEGEKDLTTFKSICDLCPCLKKLEILETSITGPSEKQAGNLSQITLPEIQADFNKLSQLSRFSCEESDGPLVVSITQAIAPFLTTLEMALDGVGCPKFDFLIECEQLRVLKLSTEFHPPLKSYFVNKVNPSTFLPLLEEVQLEFCMNDAGLLYLNEYEAELEELFLKKSTLKSIDVLCLHHLAQTEEETLDLFRQWPLLVSFKYKMPRKFTVDMGLKLLSHLPHLRSLSLYKDIKYRCSSEFYLLKRACRLREVKLELHLFLDTYLCIEGELDDDLISTSDESETE